MCVRAQAVNTWPCMWERCIYLLCWQRGWAPSVHYMNSECHSVLEKPVILNDSLIEKDCMSGDRGAGRKSLANLPFSVCHTPSRLSRTATCIISRQDTTYRMSWHPHRADLAISGNVQPFISPAGTKEWNDYLMWSCLFCFSAPSPSSRADLGVSCWVTALETRAVCLTHQGWAAFPGEKLSSRQQPQRALSSLLYIQLLSHSKGLLPPLGFQWVFSGAVWICSGIAAAVAGRILCHSAVPAALLWHLLPLHGAGAAWHPWICSWKTWVTRGVTHRGIPSLQISAGSEILLIKS